MGAQVSIGATMIIRRKYNSHYTAVPNRIFEDENISLAARGLLGYLLVKPDSWEVRVDDLQKRGGVGREKAQQLLRELVESGYIVRETTRDGGKFVGYNYIVYDEPQPETGIPFSAPETAKPATVNPSPTKEPKKVITHSPSLRSGERARATKDIPSKPLSTSGGTRLAEDWQPSDADIGFARSLDLKDDEIRNEADKFRDFWISKPGAGGRKADWPATWRNWIRRFCETSTVIQHPGRRAGNGARATPHQQRAAAFRDVAGRLDEDSRRAREAAENGAESGSTAVTLRGASERPLGD